MYLLTDFFLIRYTLGYHTGREMFEKTKQRKHDSRSSGKNKLTATCGYPHWAISSLELIEDRDRSPNPAPLMGG